MSARTSPIPMPSACNCRQIGYLAREIAYVLAPLLDLEEGPSVYAVLESLPRQRTPTALARRDVVRVRIELTRASPGQPAAAT
ncbi:HIRAN domain-containing protein [Nonomuraea guangzhouensis]|uniref:HIRAN domain-containing protein n=1 Tax=Nonomuraea guangzhouensis TaxID=1291555 RepID=A0ABW4GV02_9ACTN|nr:HIRAN domain-containing protein [Nonomuraea guangzhouensis]